MADTIWAISDGDSLCGAGRQDREAIRKLPRGRQLRLTVSAPRNPKRHRKFFAAIAAAYEQWPESHEFQPESSEHLRAWLLCKVGHYATIDIDPDHIESLADGIATVAAIARREHVFVRVGTGGRIRVFIPKSQAFANLSESAFKPIMDAVFDEIEIAIGRPPEVVLDEKEKAA